MLGGLVLVLPLLAVLATLALVLVTVPGRRRAIALDAATFPGLARLRRSTLVGRLVAVGVGLAVLVPVAGAGRLGLGAMLVPAAFATVQVLGVLVTDVVTRGDARTAGVAGLEVRRARDYLPGRLLGLVSAAGVVLAGLLAWTTAVGDPDDAGRPGRAFAYACTEGCTSGTFSPWPGSYYSLPLAAALAGVAVLAGLAVRVTVRRPRNGADPEVVRVDDAVRRRSVESVVAGVGIAVAGSLAGVGVVAGAGLASPGRPVPGVLQAVGWPVLAAGLAALVLLVWCVVVLLLPGARSGGSSALSGRGRASQRDAGAPAAAARGRS